MNFLRFLSEGKRWPNDYVRVGFNLIKTAISKNEFKYQYSDDDINSDLNKIVKEFDPLKHKNSNLGYFSPIITMLIGYSKNSEDKKTEFIDKNLKTIVKRLDVISHDSNLETEEFKENFKKKWSYEDFINYTKPIFDKIDKDLNSKLNSIKDTYSDYDIIRIDSYRDLNLNFGGNKTGYNGNSEWCHTNGEHTYNNWTDDGKYNFFILAKKGWEDIKPPNPNTTNAYDEYGLSLIAILVEIITGNLLNCTLRWNHIIEPNKPGTTVDNAFLGWGDLSEAVGINVKEEVEKQLEGKKEEIKDKANKINNLIKKRLKNKTEINSKTFTNEEQNYITNLVIPDNITKINENTFIDGYKYLTSVTLPKNLKKINEST